MNDEVLIDPFSAATFDPETDEICCPTCGSWTTIDDLEPDELGVGTCVLCR